MANTWRACRMEVFNRGRAPVDVLDALVDWARQAPDAIFEANARRDIYTQVRPELGPWVDLAHRRAVMLEVLRVLGGFESAWHWSAGRDASNPTSNTPCTEEAGIFQCSGNAMNFDDSLRDLLGAVTGGDTSCAKFIEVTKADHDFAIGFCARLLRFTVNHHGPVKFRRINRWLSRDAVAEFQSNL